MKRPVEEEDDRSTSDDKKMKKVKPEEDPEGAEWSTSVLMDEDLLYEVLKYADVRTLATAACVSKQWHVAAYDERLWELICTRHTGYGSHQLRSVVLALGGFRRHAIYLWNLSKPSSSSSPASSSSTWPCLPQTPVVPGKSAASTAKSRWGKDEVHLSLSLLALRYYESMNFIYRGKGH